MPTSPKPGSRFPIVRRFWKPVALTGAGGTAATIWFEEILLFAEEILALIFLPLLAGVIYLLDIFIFKSRMPKRKDLTYSSNQRKGG